MKLYTSALSIGLICGAIVVLLSLYMATWCGLGFAASALSAMLICTAKGIA